jgi:CheY-like chemotaxis protein
MSEKLLKCLLIDDDRDDQEIFLMAVSSTGLEVDCQVASDANEGLEKLKKYTDPPDFIFLDLNMPHIDGKKCLQEIRKMQFLKDVPVIIYSTSSYIEDIRETRRLGATGFITKPSNLAELVQVLTKIFGKNYVFPSSAYYQ